jgi:DNA-binding MarR family transcriptional regulator
LTLEQLRVFVEVAERLHVTQAAAALNMTQPAASAAVQALEQRLGTALFNRVGRHLELTEAGRVLLPEAKSILAKVLGAEQALAELGSLLHGRLCLWASHTLRQHLTRSLLPFSASLLEGRVAVGRRLQAPRKHDRRVRKLLALLCDRLSSGRRTEYVQLLIEASDWGSGAWFYARGDNHAAM